MTTKEIAFPFDRPRKQDRNSHSPPLLFVSNTPVRRSMSGDWGEPEPATAVVTVPAGVPLLLAITHRSQLSRLLEADFSDIEHLSVRSDDFPIVGSELKFLTGFRHLKGLDLDGTDITDNDLPQLATLEELEYLLLGGTRISSSEMGGPGLMPLGVLQNLRGLELEGTCIAGSDLTVLRHLRKIVELGLSRIPYNLDDGLQWVAALPKLTHLSLKQSVVSDLGANKLGESKSINTLDLESTNVTDDCITGLSKIGSLRHLNLSFTKVAGKSLALLPHVKDLNLAGTKIRGPGLRQVSKLTQLFCAVQF